MTIREAMNQADGRLKNTIPEDTKVKWLSNLDHNIFLNVFKTHEDSPIEEFTPYTEATDLLTTELLVGSPWDEMYIYYLKAKYHQEMHEIDRYNNEAAQYAEIFGDFKAFYNRTHMPIEEAREVYF